MNKDLQHAREKRYRQSQKGQAKRNAAQAKRRKTNPQPMRDWRLKRYGLTQTDFEMMAANQANVCAICFRPSSEEQHRVLRVDHNHKTGKIRGLLCHHCNVALGHFGDCIPLLKNAILYLKAAGASDNGADGL